MAIMQSKLKMPNKTPDKALKIARKIKKVKIKHFHLLVLLICLSALSAAIAATENAETIERKETKTRSAPPVTLPAILPVILKVEPDQALTARLVGTSGNADKAGFCGGDAAYSIAAKDLSLWLFGDSFYGKIEDGKRKDCLLPRNCIAIDKHLDKKGKLQFQISAADFFAAPKPDGSYFWPGDGVYLNKNRFLIFQHLIKTDTALPAPFQFRISANYATYLDIAPFKAKSQAKIITKSLEIKTEDSLLALACLKEREKEGNKSRDYLYLYNTAERMSKAGSHPCTISRLPLEEIANPEKIAQAIANMEWWQDGWQRNQKQAAILFADGASEMSVVRIPGLKRLYAFYIPADKSAIMMRSAKRPEGPWSDREEVLALKPGDGLFCYSVKAHPEYSRKHGQLSLTYNVNATDSNRLFADSSLYFPKAIKIEVKETD